MTNKKVVIGWREWIDLQELGLPHIKAKVDTGAKTSCLHAFKLKPFKRDGADWIRFWVHPHQHDLETEVVCEAPVHDRRVVTDSGGHRSERYVIRSTMTAGDVERPIEITLTNRDTMKFRMLLGREALAKTFVVDIDRSFNLGGSDEIPPGQPADEEEE